MQFYLGTYTGTGTDSDPFRPVGTDSIVGWSSIDLRVNSTVVTGRCLLALPDGSANPSGAVQLGTNLDASLTNQQTNTINSALGVSLPTGLTRRQAIVRLLTVDGAGRWGTVRPELVAGARRLRIYLGGLAVHDVAA
jgi:hypothetical protein